MRVFKRIKVCNLLSSEPLILMSASLSGGTMCEMLSFPGRSCMEGSTCHIMWSLALVLTF